MYNPTRQLLNASLRNDYASFAERAFQTVNPGTEFLSNWHQQAIAYHLEESITPTATGARERGTAKEVHSGAQAFASRNAQSMQSNQIPSLALRSGSP